MLRDIRTNYQQFKLEEDQLTEHPMELFRQWMNEAIQNKVEEPTAMTLSTCTDNEPDSRIVLLKGLAENGFIFYTNYNSKKGKQLQQNPQAALNFFWPPLERQVRVKGVISKLNKEESEAYFQSRPRDSQLGAWASPQSTEIGSRKELEDEYTRLSEQFKDEEIKMPEHWGGYLVSPTEIEFWQGRPNRLHDRFRYFLIDDKWQIKRLAP